MKSKRVLIVDDDNLSRTLFENLIGQFWSIESARNGIEAIEKLTEGTFDLILMDIQMPLLDGISTMRKIREDGISSCPVIAVTAFADEKSRYSFLEQGFDEFITKPVRPKDFLELIRNTIHGHIRCENSKSGMTEDIPEVFLDKKVLAQLMKYYNSPHAIREVFQSFIVEATGLCKKALDAYELNEFKEIASSIHTIKGNSGTLGINRIFLLAQEIEFLTKNGENFRIQKSLIKLLNEIKSFNHFIKEEAIFES